MLNLSAILALFNHKSMPLILNLQSCQFQIDTNGLCVRGEVCAVYGHMTTLCVPKGETSHPLK